MASIVERNHKFKVVYYYKNDAGKRIQKWETYDTKAEARKRKKEIEYKQELGTFVAPKCTYLSELLDEYVIIYGTKAWVMSTYQGKVGRWTSACLMYWPGEGPDISGAFSDGF